MSEKYLEEIKFGIAGLKRGVIRISRNTNRGMLKRYKRYRFSRQNKSPTIFKSLQVLDERKRKGTKGLSTPALTLCSDTMLRHSPLKFKYKFKFNLL